MGIDHTPLTVSDWRTTAGPTLSTASTMKRFAELAAGPTPAHRSRLAGSEGSTPLPDKLGIAVQSPASKKLGAAGRQQATGENGLDGGLGRGHGGGGGQAEKRGWRAVRSLVICLIFGTVVTRGRCRRVRSCGAQVQEALPGQSQASPLRNWIRPPVAPGFSDGRLLLEAPTALLWLAAQRINLTTIEAVASEWPASIWRVEVQTGVGPAADLGPRPAALAVALGCGGKPPCMLLGGSAPAFHARRPSTCGGKRPPSRSWPEPPLRVQPLCGGAESRMATSASAGVAEAHRTAISIPSSSVVVVGLG